MSAYLKFFELEQSPFEGKAQSRVVLGTRALRDAFAAIRDGLSEGSARICVNGGPGFGKTSLARSLPKLLGESARVAVVLDPSVPWESLRSAIAKQWRLESEGLARTGLLEAARETRLVLVVDRAEQATEDFLDHLDIMLSVRSESDEPAVQSVLLACLSTADGQPPPLIWWLDRIQTLQLEFAPIPRDGVESYIHKHLKRAGWRGERLFNAEAALAIHGVTGGIPGEISSLCERLLAQAAEDGHRQIDAYFVYAALDESGDDRDDDEDHDRDDAESTIEDEFEELVHEEEFEGAGPSSGDEPFDDASGDNAATGEVPAEAAAEDVDDPPASPTLAQTLEHFEQEDADWDESDTSRRSEQSDQPEEGELVEEEDDDAVIELSVEIAGNAEDATDEIDEADTESLNQLEEYLGAPASPEELLAIRRGAWLRPLRAAAAVAAAILIGASAFAWFGDDGDSSPRSAAVQPAGDSHRGPDGKVLVRLRGPVTAIDAPAKVPATPFIAETALSEPAGSKMAQILPPADADTDSSKDDFQLHADVDDLDDLDEVFEKGDFVDMRPASMRPDAALESDEEARFW